MSFSRPPVLLLVDDEDAIRDVVGRCARSIGFEVIACANGRAAISQLKTRGADLALVDLRMPDIGGLDVLRAIRAADPHCQIVLMTAHASIDTAVEAIKLGATDYFTKPLDLQRLKQFLSDTRRETEQRYRLLTLESDVARQLEFCGMVGVGAKMQELFSLIRRLAPHFRTALVTGETGTGKELVAGALHKLSARRQNRFVALNCSTIVQGLFESELFGHVRGAFTGATDNKAGLFELAEHGTLFLDEVGELPLAVQGKLLRALELGEVQRVGSLESRRIDVHVIAATNRDLRSEVSAGRFRSDLFYRLNIVEVRVPPLRDRREDIPYLTAAFLRDFAKRLSKPRMALTSGSERVLIAAPWPGNVRELRNVLERASILADGELVTEREVTECLHRDAPKSADEDQDLIPARGELGTLSAVEREYIVRALEEAGGNKKAAAKVLGLSRRALYRRLERYELDDRIQRRANDPHDGSDEWPADDEGLVTPGGQRVVGGNGRG